MLLINNQAVEQILDMKGCIEALETGYRDLVRERANYRGRYDFFVPNDDPKLMYRWGTMEGASRTFETMAIRMKSDMLEWPEGKTVEKYCVAPGTFCGIVMVFSTRNGEPLAIINDGLIQHMRVGGCAGLGVKYLAREDAGVVGILGSGGMARTYLLAFNEVRKIREVRVYSPTKKNRESYATEMSQRLDLKIVPMENPHDAVRGCDIVATCTDSIQVIVDDPAWIESGMHLTCVKANEWNPEIVTELRSRHQDGPSDETSRRGTDAHRRRSRRGRRQRRRGQTYRQSKSRHLLPRLSPAHRYHVGQDPRANRSPSSDLLRQQRHAGPAVRLHRGLCRA